MATVPLRVVEILTPKIGKPVFLRVFNNQVPAGFPSPADDYVEESLDLSQWLIKNKISTFIVEVQGDSMLFELHSGDRLIVDRSLEPRHRDVVLACIDGEVTVKRLIIKEGKRYLLTPDNEDFPLIELSGNQELIIWGVVTYSIHRVR